MRFKNDREDHLRHLARRKTKFRSLWLLARSGSDKLPCVRSSGSSTLRLQWMQNHGTSSSVRYLF